MLKHVARLFGLVTVFIFGALLICRGAAQVAPVNPAAGSAITSQPSSKENSPVTANVTQTADTADYILGQGDRLSIRVFGAEDLPESPVDVSAQGDITAPLIGQVKAGGTSVSELRSILTEKYRKFYKNPEVSLTVVEYRSQPVTVVGSVNTPGVIQLRRPTRVMDVISQAGGLRPDAGDRVFITRVASPQNSADQESRTPLTREIDLHKIIEGEDPSLNILVRSNDLITIPKAKMVYVVGEVSRPGGYVLDGHGNTISVLQAVALAGGVNKTAASSKARILDEGTGDNMIRDETPINLQKILASRAPDVALHADEILFVPNSAAKSVGLRTLEMTSNVLTGLAIWRF